MPNADSSLNYRDPMEFISPASIFYDLELFFSLSLVLLVEFYFGDIVENSPLLEIKFFFFFFFSPLSTYQQCQGQENGWSLILPVYTGITG